MAAALLLAAGTLQAGPTRAQKLSPLSDSLRKVSKVPSSAARAAFRKFSAAHGGGWQVRYNPRTALPEALTGGRTSRYAGDPEQAALAFFTENRDLLKADPQALRLVLKKEFMGVTHLQYQQYKDGLPVEFSYARVHVSAAGEISGYQGRFEPDLSVNTVPSVSAPAAAAAASADLGLRLASPKTELVLYPDEASGGLKLAWKVRGRAGGLWVYYVDASDGKVLFKYDDLRRAACPALTPTFGNSAATVYAISPLPGYNTNSLALLESDWQPTATKALRDQYVWVGDYTVNTVTDKDGDYCSSTDGKVFSSIKGPYFSVTNFRGASAHWDNAGGEWRPQSVSVQSPHPYADSQSYPYPVTVSPALAAGEKFAKVMPYFSSFDVGELDVFGSLNDNDEVSVANPAVANGSAGVYIGQRTSAFYGAAIENPSYNVTLKTDAAGTRNGFAISSSRYLVLKNDPIHADNPSGSVIWSTSNPNVSFMYMAVPSPDAKQLGDANALSEVNAFYHLNAARHYFDNLNLDPMHPDAVIKPADLSKRVPVMVHAHGEADKVGGACSFGDPTCNGMLNAFYDLENDNIMIGDGQIDFNGKYRSFALDGTIVRHEYIHLVVNRIYPIINFGEFGAISEALADYFAMSSFWNEGYTSQTVLGNYVGSGEGAARDISGSGSPTTQKSMPGDWRGEVHDDSLMISQPLYSLRLGSRHLDPNPLAPVGLVGFPNRSVADVLTFAALFYFPDNFLNFRDAMKAACTDLRSNGCTSSMEASIDSAFGDHGIVNATSNDPYETGSNSKLCENNDGPECASEIGDAVRISSATIYPLGDVDYYSLPLSAGDFTAKLNFPPGTAADTYNAYALYLFDSDRNIVRDASGVEVVAVPGIYNDPNGVCPDIGDCLTLSPSVTLSYNIPLAGRYYLVVAAAPTSSYSNSSANSQLPYSVDLSRTPIGSAQASILTAAYDSDAITFNVPYNKFAMSVSPSSSSALSGAEQVFEYAQLRDHNYVPIAGTLTNLPGTYMKLVNGTLNTATFDILGRPILSGQVRLQPGFGARYPGVGTVYVEVFGRNHMGQVISMGVSNALNLSANRSAATAYNNIIKGGSSALVKYELLAAGTLTVKIYTQSGSLVKTLFDGAVPAGKGTLEWDGGNSTGGQAASGIYFVKTKGPGLDKIIKIAVVR